MGKAKRARFEAKPRKFDFHINPYLVSLIFYYRFPDGNAAAAENHILTFEDACARLEIGEVDPKIVKAKLFQHSLSNKARAWYDMEPKGNINSWYNMKMSFLAKFGKRDLPNKKVVVGFKQEKGETLTEAWIRLKKYLMMSMALEIGK